MTRCEFHTDGERITGFSVSGHSDYDEPGKDIVCAAVSAVVTMAEATINDVCGAKAKVRVKDGEDNRITLTPPRVLRRGGHRSGSACRNAGDSVFAAGRLS